MTRLDTASSKQVFHPYKLISPIAENHTNAIALVQNAENHAISVAKILNEDQRALLVNLKAEATLLASLDHQRILKSEGFKNVEISNAEGESFQAPVMLMEYAKNGDLFDLLGNFKMFPAFIARSYAKMMVSAVSYLHELNIAHLDLKLENFLLDKNYEIKLADFGFARKIAEGQMIDAQVGTPDYWSPEQKALAPYNAFKVDVFNLAIVIFIIVAGRMPFVSADKDDEYYSHIYNGEFEKFWEMHEEDMNPSSSTPFFRGEFKSMINGMLRFNPEERLTMQEVLNHSWLNISSELVDKCGGIVAEFLKKKSRIN